MPLYEYYCSKCEKTFEVIQKFSDSPLVEHENCGGPVERLLSAPAFQLKGTGWYVTDYGKSGAKASDTSTEGKGNGSQPPAGSSEAKTEPKSSEAQAAESKPETKTPAAKSSD